MISHSSGGCEPRLCLPGYTKQILLKELRVLAEQILLVPCIVIPDYPQHLEATSTSAYAHTIESLDVRVQVVDDPARTSYSNWPRYWVYLRQRHVLL